MRVAALLPHTDTYRIAAPLVQKAIKTMSNGFQQRLEETQRLAWLLATGTDRRCLPNC
jgi:hypothetical protein